MIRRKDEQSVEMKCIRGGIGEVEMHKLLNGEQEMYGKGRMFNHMILAPGNTIGTHTHNGDNEIFYMLSGVAEYDDNGTVTELKPGDVVVCNSGETHGMKNKGTEPVEFIAMILY